MNIISSVREMQLEAERLRHAGKKIAVVPTMGFLHEGHLSLMRIARTYDIVMSTIFVNPTQFAPHEDFSKYPRNLERDSELAESAGTDILFTPSISEIYQQNHRTFIDVEKLTTVLEGKSRPTHFRGVTTIVAKLFNITKPHVGVFGQKDVQQVVVIQRMIRDLNFDIEILVGPTVREPDGLAMSSRNVFLSESERAQSTVLFRSLRHAEELLRSGERHVSRIVSAMNEMITHQPSAKIDYLSIADVTSLEELSDVQERSNLVISLAVWFGTTRLIDNIQVSLP